MPLLNNFPRRPPLWEPYDRAASQGAHPRRRAEYVPWLIAVIIAAALSGLILYILGFRAGERALRQGGQLHRRLDYAAGEAGGERSNAYIATPDAKPSGLSPWFATAVPAPPFPGQQPAPPALPAGTAGSSKSVRLPAPSRPRPAIVRSWAGKHYGVQVFAGKIPSHARNMAHQLRRLGFPVLLLTPTPRLGAAFGLYRVLAGPYRDLRQAESAVRQLHRQRLSAFIRHWRGHEP